MPAMSLAGSEDVAPRALFEIDGDRVVATEVSRGRWWPDALHGGPVAALVARASELHPSEQPMFVARLTVELLRPVPLAALAVRTTLLRPGRRVQLVGTSVAVGEAEVARAVALRIREADLPEARTPPDQLGWPRPDSLTARVESIPTADESLTAYHSHAVEMRFVSGHASQPRPAPASIPLPYP